MQFGIDIDSVIQVILFVVLVIASLIVQAFIANKRECNLIIYIWATYGIATFLYDGFSDTLDDFVCYYKYMIIPILCEIVKILYQYKKEK